MFKELFLKYFLPCSQSFSCTMVIVVGNIAVILVGYLIYFFIKGQD